MLPTDAGKTLLGVARAAISAALGRHLAEPDDAAWQQQLGASFVTLTQAGNLRGCIGSLEARRSVRADVKANALAAAFHDPRFPPLTAQELDQTCIEVSLLSALTPLQYSNEAEALAQLHPGSDGLVLEYGQHRSTFLPQVWEQLPKPAAFLAQLKRKAGLSVDFWSDAVKLQRYTVSKWSEASATVADTGFGTD